MEVLTPMGSHVNENENKIVKSPTQSFKNPKQDFYVFGRFVVLGFPIGYNGEFKKKIKMRNSKFQKLK